MKYKKIKIELKRCVAVLGAALMMFQTPLAHVAAYADTTVSENSVSGNSVYAQTQQTDESAEVIQQDLPMNYTYVESWQLSFGQKQNILVSLGDGKQEWTDASMVLENSADGTVKEVPVTQFSEDALLFSFSVDGWTSGVYRMVKVSYSYIEDSVLMEGCSVFDDIEQMENVCFGLNAENPISAAEFTEYDKNGELVLDDEQTGGIETDGLEVSVVPLTEDAQGSTKIPVADDVTTENKIAGSTVVVLDPGHDDTHAGARANGLEEEDLTLKVALYCKEYLEDNYSDVVVYMSRDASGACPYPGTKSADCNAARVTVAKQLGADVYVSLHFNSTEGTTTANGAMVFYPNSNYDNSVGTAGATLASKIIEQLAKLGLNNNGIRIRNSEDNTTYPDGSLADYYGVIRRGKLEGIPAVIVEHAFLNNPTDAAFLTSEDNLKKLGISDALGIAQAYNLSTEEVEYDADELEITEVDGFNGTFKITLSGATPVKRIADIKFKVYPMEDKEASYLYTAELVNKKKGIYTVTANVGNHGKKEGKYKVIAYAYNAAGKKVQLRSEKFTITKSDPDTSGMSVITNVASAEKTVTVKLKGNADANGVYFRVYNKNAGKKTAEIYNAKRLEDGGWRAKVTVSDHKRAGEYVVEAVSKTYFGTKEKVATGKFNIVGPTATSLSVAKLNLDKGTFRVIVKGVDSKAGIKKVTAVVKTLTGKKLRKSYTMKKSKNGYYYVDVKMKSFKYQYATYGIYIKVKDGNGIQKTVKTLEKKISRPDPVLTAKLKSKQTKITMTASNLGMSSSVKGVKFKVYHVSDTSVKKSYAAQKGTDGSYSAIMKVSDFGKSGKYKIITYVKGTDGKYTKTGKAKTVTVSDIEGGKVLLKNKTDSQKYVYVKNISYKGKISKVKLKVWPVSNTKAKYTYTASVLSTGAYRVLIDSENHKGIGGKYKYQVIAESTNGIRKVLLSGKVELGESNPEAEVGELYPISGKAGVTVAQMMSYYKKNASYPSFYAASDAPTLKKFCQIYYNECQKEGIRVEVAFAQAMKETNFLRYGGDVDISQYNFAGIGATGGGAKGNSFASVKLGVRAQIQHLKAYANEEDLVCDQVDPRFDYVTRGTAPYVEWLAISVNPYGKGWATDATYGTALRQMITALRNS